MESMKLRDTQHPTKCPINMARIQTGEYTLRCHLILLECKLSKTQPITRVSEDVKRREPLCTLGNVNWCSQPLWKQHGDSSKD